MRDTGRFAISMFKTGIIGFGGGNALIPLIEQEAVKKEKFLTEEEFERKVVIASITPGALPIELAGGIGKQLSGVKGMLIGASAIAFPGTVVMLIMLMVTLLASQSVIHQIEFLFVGITGYILCLLSGYIKETIQKVHGRNRYIHILVMCIIYLMSGMKNVYRMLGIQEKPPVSLSTSQIFALFFLFMMCTGKKKTKVKMEDVIAMLKNIKWKSVVKGFLFFIIVTMPAVFVTSESIPFVGKGILSSLMSFGGGDAYLTVADGLFIDGTLISEDLFYGYLVPIVNVLPGSILCKVLSGIGYMIGYHTSQNILAGCVVAIAGFFCAIFSSCGIFGIVEYVYEIFDELPVFCRIKRWVRTVVSGLIFSVISSLVYQNVRLQQNYGYKCLIIIMLGIFIIDILMQKVGVKNKKIVMISISLSFFLCNVLYM